MAFDLLLEEEAESVMKSQQIQFLQEVRTKMAAVLLSKGVFICSTQSDL